jgi:hypothetical protein
LPEAGIESHFQSWRGFEKDGTFSFKDNPAL